MALRLNGIEPVVIKGRQCVPFIDAETKLRLQMIKAYDAKDDKILASVFPEDEEYVLKYLTEAPVIEKEILHAYLVGGEKAVETVMDGFNKKISQAFDKIPMGEEE